jgi:hypothetical protein
VEYDPLQYSPFKLGAAQVLGCIIYVHRRTDRQKICGTRFSPEIIRHERKLEPFLASFLLFKDLRHPNIMNFAEIFSRQKYWYVMWERMVCEELTLRDIIDVNILDEYTICHFWSKV